MPLEMNSGKSTTDMLKNVKKLITRKTWRKVGRFKKKNKQEPQSECNEAVTISAVSSRSYLCLMIFSKVMKQILKKKVIWIEIIRHGL